LHLYRTRNKADIRKILEHPEVRPWLIDDLTPDDYQPNITDDIIYLINKEKTGVIRVDPMNGICCQGHLATLPEMRGHASEFTRSAIDWVFKNTRYQKIVTMVPDYNVKTLRVCEKVGMEREGELKKSFLKDWNLYSMIIFGISKSKEG
jgi:RimJ/RimL family protein N-acetyltransferase